MATHSSILAWRTPWTEEPGGLQPKESPRVGHGWSDSTCRHALKDDTTRRKKSLEPKQKTQGTWLLLRSPFRGTVSVRGHLASDDSPLSPESPFWTSHSPFSGGALPVAACYHGKCQRTALWTPLPPNRHLRCYLELKGLYLFQTAPSEWYFKSVEVTLLSPQTTSLQPEGAQESPAPPSTPAGVWRWPTISRTMSRLAFFYYYYQIK